MPIHKKFLFVIICIGFFTNACSRALLDGNPASVKPNMSGLHFGEVGIGQIVSESLTLRNIGETVATLVSTSFDQPGFQFTGGSFPGTGGTCSTSISADQENCTVSIAFTPTEQQQYTGNLLVTYNDGSNVIQMGLPVSGTGVGAGTVDTVFGNRITGSSGLLSLDLGGDDALVNLQVLPNKNILGTGTSNNGTNENTSILGLQSLGLLDPLFGSGGIARVYVGPNTNDLVHASVLQSDGKLVAVGASNALLGGTNLDLSLLRIGDTGILDSLFDSDGIFNQHFLVGALSAITRGLAVEVQTDGKIVVGGSLKLPALNSDFLATRLLSTGVVDPLFGLSGLSTVGFSVNNTDVANAVAIQADGNIILAGTTDNATQKNSAFVRLLGSTGLVDITYGTLGSTAKDICGGSRDDEVKDVALQPDGKLIAVGYCKNAAGDKDIFSARLLSTGALDPTYGSGGVLKIDIAGFNDEANCVAIQSDGKIVLGGYANNGLINVPVVVRTTSGGVLDSTFGVSGIVQKTVGPSNAKVQALQLQGQKILIGGSYENTANDDIWMMRLFQ